MAQAPVQPADVGQSNKIPLFFANEKDSIDPRTWLDRVDQLKAINAWSDITTINAAAYALRDIAEVWHRVEIKKYNVTVWDDFKARFLVFTGANLQSFKGFLLFPKLNAPRNNKKLSDYYVHLADNMNDYQDTLPDVGTFNWPTEITAHATHAQAHAQVPVGLQRLYQQYSCAVMKRHMVEHFAMGLFYGGISDKAKEFLRDKNVNTLLEMKNLLFQYEMDMKNSGRQIDAIDEDIDAVKIQRQKTAPARTDYKKKTNVQCYYCQKMNHTQKECRKRQRDKAPMVKPPQRVNEIDERQVQQNFEQFNSLNSF